MFNGKILNYNKKGGIYMDFNQNKADLLKNISQKKHDNIMAQRSAQAQSRMKEKASGHHNIVLASAASAEQTNKPPVVIFGLKSLFMSTLKNLLQQYCDITEFDEVEKASDFLFENKVLFAVMDLDPPNDSKACQDFFNTGKTITPDMKYIVYQKEEKLGGDAELLQKQGAMVLRKPLDRIELIDLVKKYTSIWREKNVAKSQPDSEVSK
jgi:hypothetical protein